MSARPAILVASLICSLASIASRTWIVAETKLIRLEFNFFRVCSTFLNKCAFWEPEDKVFRPAFEETWLHPNALYPIEICMNTCQTVMRIGIGLNFFAVIVSTCHGNSWFLRAIQTTSGLCYVAVILGFYLIVDYSFSVVSVGAGFFLAIAAAVINIILLF